MDYAKLKTEIKEIAEIAEMVPEPFRLKCFETLLGRLLASESPAVAAAAAPPAPPPPAASQPPLPASTPFAIPTQLRVLMQRTALTEEDIRKVVLVADGDVHFIKEPAGKKIAEGQTDWALLLALKNCILNDSLTVDPETVRSVCQDKGYYDRANFAAIFKRGNYAKFFKGPMEAQGQPQGLTNEGQTELANLVRGLAAAS